MSIIETLNQAIIDDRDEEYSGKTKTTFWASESEVMAFDIYHRFIGTTPTHQMSEEKMLMLKMRKLTEEAVIHFLRRTGNVIDKFTNQERVYFEWGPNKVPISGYPDLGLETDNGPIIAEVKTYYGGKNHSEVRVGKIKPSYLKQLAIYLYHFKMDHGVLLMINQGTGEMFEFDLYREGGDEYVFTCPDNEMMIDLRAVFSRWEKIWVENVQKKVEPALEYVYKYPIDKIKWNEISADAIRKARSGQAVIGDWQCKYSDFKGLIAEREHTTLGYTEEELKKIREMTVGYSTKKAGQVKFDPKDL